MTDEPQDPPNVWQTPPATPGAAPEPPAGSEVPPGFGQPPAGYGPPPGYSMPPAGYGYPPQPGYGYYPQQAPGTNGLAIASLITGILGFIYILPAVLGIIFGFVALSQIRRTGQQGRGMAIAGIVFGFVWLALLVVAIIALVASAHFVTP